MAIVIGYQGVGKSTMCRKHNDCIDLESSSFWFKDENNNPKRWNNWAEIYGNIAEHLSRIERLIVLNFASSVINRTRYHLCYGVIIFETI